ncbi:MAG: TolC family protein [Pyrinomonadaceae bacterium]
MRKSDVHGGFAALSAAKLCFAVRRGKFNAAAPPKVTPNGGIAAESLVQSTEKRSFSANRAAKPQIFLISTLLLFGSAVTSAQTPPPDEPPPTQPTFTKPLPPMPDATRVGVDIGSDLPLTIEQAIEMALKNNNDIDASRNEARIAEFNLRSARGIYDPLFNSQSYFESRTTPTASIIGGAVTDSITQRQFFGDVGLTGFVPRYGGSYDVVFNSSRLTSTSRNPTLNPQFPSSFTATFVQPLWRNRSIDGNRRTIEIAKKNINISDSQLKQRAMDVVSGVEQAYWDLAFALRNLQVQTDTLKQAREQIESNKRLATRGVLAPIEIVAAEAQMSTFEGAVYLAQETVTRAENALKTLLLPDRKSADWSRPLTPVTPAELDIPRIGLEVATAEALKNRPEIEQFALSEDINRIDQKFYRNQTKPQVDLVSSFTSAGLAGTRNPTSTGTPPPSLVGGYFDSLGNLVSLNFPTYRAGVQISFPLRNRTAQANLGRTLVEGDRLANNRAQAEQIIEAEVRNALQALRSAESRLKAATEARAAAEELYASEQRQFRGGATTFYLVLQRQNDLTTARGRELQSRTDLNKAISEFHRVIGKTLAVNNITVTK